MSHPNDVASPEWLKQHNIAFVREAGYYESPTAWIRVGRLGHIIGAGEKDRVPQLKSLGTVDAEMTEEEQNQGAARVFAQIQRAVRTMRLLPEVKVRNRYCNWPDFIENFYTAYGYTESSVRVVPTAKQLSELDQVIRWLAWLSNAGAEYPLIVWARASGFSKRRIAAKVGLSPNTCMERFRVGMCAILYNIDKID